jgi:hypothetical protein
MTTNIMHQSKCHQYGHLHNMILFIKNMKSVKSLFIWFFLPYEQIILKKSIETQWVNFKCNSIINPSSHTKKTSPAHQISISSSVKKNWPARNQQLLFIHLLNSVLTNR